jgi:hypothetical protein
MAWCWDMLSRELIPQGGPGVVTCQNSFGTHRRVLPKRRPKSGRVVEEVETPWDLGMEILYISGTPYQPEWMRIGLSKRLGVRVPTSDFVTVIPNFSWQRDIYNFSVPKEGIYRFNAGGGAVVDFADFRIDNSVTPQRIYGVTEFYINGKQFFTTRFEYGQSVYGILRISDVVQCVTYRAMGAYRGESVFGSFGFGFTYTPEPLGFPPDFPFRYYGE